MRLLSDPDARKLLLGKPGTINLPVDFQLGMMGVSGQDLDGLRGKKALDLGCGNGKLVRYLSDRGISAEGLAPDAPMEGPYMRQKVSSVHPLAGCIPRDDESYDVVFANSFPPFSMAFCSYRDASVAGSIDSRTAFLGAGIDKVEGELRDYGVSGHLAMIEALRVTKQGGRVVCSPMLDLLEGKMAFEFSQGNYRVEHPVSPLGIAIAREIEANPDGADFMRSFGMHDDKLPDYFKHATVVHKR